MKNLKTILTVAASACAFSMTASAAINIQTSYVGDAGNANDSTGYGGVSYGYHVGTYEVTNSQYVSFLNAKGASNTHGVFNSSMSTSYGGIQQSGTSGSFTYSVKSGFGDKPVNYVSFWDAARFTNWQTNGQGSGSTETGVYTLNNVTNPTNNTVTRNSGTWDAGGVAVASEDEWYKAAYYDPTLNGGAGGYWDYAHQSDSITTADANYDYSVGTLTDVGAYSNDGSAYGTFDQGGNVWEWNDAIANTIYRDLRGGAFDIFDATLQSSFRNFLDPASESISLGFRVSSLAPIPEPATYAAIFGCLALTLATIRRKGRRTL